MTPEEKAERDNHLNEVLYGGKWETYEGRSVPAGHARARMAAHKASQKRHGEDEKGRR